MFSTIITHDRRKPMKVRAADRKFCGPYRWNPSEPGKGRGFYQDSKALRMDRAGSSFDLRLEYANDFLRGSRLARTVGYYAGDHYVSDMLQPIVARLPKGRGFLAGWTMGTGMCAALDATIWDTAEDAARAAHDEAERDAERMREASEAED